MDNQDDSCLEIITVGHPTLRKRADEINNITQEIVSLAGRMVLSMHRAPGIGLAAPQVDRSIRLITVDLSIGENSDELHILINPEIISEEGDSTMEEGCLSVPDIRENITRPLKAVVKGVDIHGNEKTFEAEDLLARVFLHEIDHLNGKLFIDRLSPLKRKLIKKKQKKGKEKALVL